MDNLRLGLGIVAAVAGLLTAILTTALASTIIYKITKRGRKPAPKSRKMWILFWSSAIIFCVGGSLATFAAPTATDFATSTATEGSLALSSLKTQDTGPGLSLVDVIVRNTSSSDSVIHKAYFVVLEVETVPLGGHPYHLPSTHQYNAIMTPTDNIVALDLSQVVPAGGVDRFQIILALGTERAEETPWGNASIGWIIDPKTDTMLTQLDTKIVLRLIYDENKTLESSPFEFAVHAPGHGFKADKIAGFTLEEKINLLSDKDINVVESLIESLGSIGGSEALKALRALRSRDLDYLQEYYASEIYGKVKDPYYWNLPPPEERFATFMNTMDLVIEYLETSK